MNWLIISDDDDKTERAKENINKKFKESIVYALSDKDEELKTSMEVLPSITQLAILTDNLQSSVVFFAGYFCGKNLPVYFENKKAEDLFGGFENVHFFDGEEDLFSYLKKHATSIIDEDVKVSAFSYLFTNGIPFDANNFADYIIRKTDDENKKAEVKEILECYIAAGMDVNARDRDGTPMLNVACRADNIDAVKWLISLGADINAVSEDRGYTAVMDAVWRGNKDIAQYLIEQKADLNTISKEGQSNLVLAVGADRTEIVRLLAENGADPDICDSMGMSAYSYAQLFKKNEIASILEKYHKEQ